VYKPSVAGAAEVLNRTKKPAIPATVVLLIISSLLQLNGQYNGYKAETPLFLLRGYDTDSIFRADIDTEIALYAFLFVDMDGAAVHQLENFFRTHFNTLATIRAFFHIDLYVSHRSGLLLEFRRITGSEIDYVALPNLFTFLKHTLNLLTRTKFYPEQIYQQIKRQSLIT
jgi:hypothetical protein